MCKHNHSYSFEGQPELFCCSGYTSTVIPESECYLSISAVHFRLNLSIAAWWQSYRWCIFIQHLFQHFNGSDIGFSFWVSAQISQCGGIDTPFAVYPANCHIWSVEVYFECIVHLYWQWGCGMLIVFFMSGHFVDPFYVVGSSSRCSIFSILISLAGVTIPLLMSPVNVLYLMPAILDNSSFVIPNSSTLLIRLTRSQFSHL